MRTLSIVCPVYNEQDAIGAFYEELRSTLDELAGRYRAEIIFVVDRCTDDTLSRIREIAAGDARVTALSLSRRFGHQMSLLAGIDRSTGDAVVTIDSDLQHPPRVILALVEAFERGNEIVQAIRVDDGAGAGASQRFFSRAYYRVFNLFADVRLAEGSADFRLISDRVAQVIRTQFRERNLFLRGVFSWVGFQQATVSYRASARRAGLSKFSPRRRITLGLTGLIGFSRAPLHAALVTGLLAVFVACGVGAIAVVDLLCGDPPSSARALLLAVLFASGLNLTFLGVVGLYVAAVLEEARARPLYLIEEVIGSDAGGTAGGNYS